MPSLLRPMSNAYRLYLGYQFAMAAGLGLAQATIIVYWVTVAHLDPLRLVLLGTVLEVAITFPRLLGMRPALWFSVLACVVALGTTELAGRRTRRLGPASVTTTLLILTAATAVLVVVLGTARTFAVAIVAYLVISALRPAYEPLVTGWMVVRVDARVRATALSARDMCDASGQIAGGPAIGAVGNLVSVRAALLAGAAALGPAMILLITATRRIRAEFATVAAADPGAVPVTGADQA